MVSRILDNLLNAPTWLVFSVVGLLVFAEDALFVAEDFRIHIAIRSPLQGFYPGAIRLVHHQGNGFHAVTMPGHVISNFVVRP